MINNSDENMNATIMKVSVMTIQIKRIKIAQNM